MKLNKTLFQLLGATALASPLWAQPPAGAGPNLVPNPGFELVQGRRPDDDVDGSKAFRYNVKAWKSPTETTPDLIVIPPNEQKKIKSSNIKANLPHGGNMVVAILTDNPDSQRSKIYREYIQVELDKALKPGKEYYLEFWVCSDIRSRFVSNNIGVFFSPTEIRRQRGQAGSTDAGWGPLTDLKPDFNVTEVINAKQKEWVKISTIIKLAQPAKFMLVGNFFDNKETKIVEHPTQAGDFNNAYYLLDDFILCEVNPEPEPVVVIPEPEPEPVVAPPPPPPAKIKLDRVFFETAKWDLLPASTPQLEELLAWMNQYDQMEIEIQGHTDDRGPDDYNKDLSKKRAKAVYKWLLDKGIDKNRVKYIGYGEERPVADNKTEEGRQLNRRIEVIVTKINPGVEVSIETEVKPYTDRN
jgi:outer membrane protein OmpA-like peptidoglycan-associated protein